MSRQEDVLRIFLSQRPGLIHYAASRVGDRAEAEDLVQEAWLRFSAIAREKGLAEPVGYLHRILRNLILDRHRRKGVEQRLFETEPEGVMLALPDEEPSAWADLAAREELAIVRAAIAAMPERMRLAFEMHRFEGIKLVEIAARLSISKSLAQTLVVDGVEQCKKALRRGQ